MSRTPPRNPLSSKPGHLLPGARVPGAARPGTLPTFSVKSHYRSRAEHIIRQGNDDQVGKVRKVLDENVQPLSPHGALLLLKASMETRAEQTFEMLLGRFPDMPVADTSGSSVLFDALDVKRPQRGVDQLWGYMQDVHFATGSGGSPLSRLVRRDAVRLRFVKALLEQGADPNALHPFHKHSPLHVAASIGDEDCMAALLRHGADPGLRDANGQLAEEAVQLSEEIFTQLRMRRDAIELERSVARASSAARPRM